MNVSRLSVALLFSFAVAGLQAKGKPVEQESATTRIKGFFVNHKETLLNYTRFAAQAGSVAAGLFVDENNEAGDATQINKSALAGQVACGLVHLACDQAENEAGFTARPSTAAVRRAFQVGGIANVLRPFGAHADNVLLINTGLTLEAGYENVRDANDAVLTALASTAGVVAVGLALNKTHLQPRKAANKAAEKAKEEYANGNTKPTYVEKKNKKEEETKARNEWRTKRDEAGKKAADDTRKGNLRRVRGGIEFRELAYAGKEWLCKDSLNTQHTRARIEATIAKASLFRAQAALIAEQMARLVATPAADNVDKGRE